jgi:hypothetical protein
MTEGITEVWGRIEFSYSMLDLGWRLVKVLLAMERGWVRRLPMELLREVRRTLIGR